MADNTQINPGTGGDILSTDDLGAFKVQRIKVQFGPDGSASDVTTSNPLPVNIASNTASSSLGALNATTVLALYGAASAGFQIASGLTATIKPQYSNDGGSTWNDSYFFINADGFSSATRALGGSAVNGQIDFPPGATHIQIIVTAYTSGSATCTVNAGSAVIPRIIPGGTSVSSLDPSLVVSFQSSNNSVKLTDGNNIAAVKAASTAAAASDTALVVALHPTSGGVVADNAAFTDGTTRVQMHGFILDETAGTALTENDAAAARIDSKRAQICTIEDETTRGTRVTVKAASTAAAATDKALVVALSPNNGAKITDGTNTAAVKAASTAPATTDPALVVALSPNSPTFIQDNSAFTDGTTYVQATGYVFDDVAGTALTENDLAAARIDSKRAQVSVIEGSTRGTRAEVKAASTAAVATDPALVVAISPNNAVVVGGNVANDSADSGNPVKVGAKAINAWATAVANADRVDAIADLLGRQLIGYKPPELQKSFSATYTTTQTGTALWTPSAGKKCVVTSVTISTTSTTAGKLTLWWGASADTTYNEGTDQPLEAAYFIPSSTASPGMTKIYTDAIAALNADYVLRVTTSAALNCVVTVHGYEV